MKFTAGEKTYELRFSVNAMADLEEQTGKSFTELLTSGEFSGVRALLCGGLMESMPDITIKQAGSILESYIKDGHSIVDATNMIVEACRDAGFFPKAQTAPKIQKK